MKIISRFQAEDGTVFTSEVECLKHERLCREAQEVMAPLELPSEMLRRVESGEGWYQHDIEKVNAAKEGILALCRPDYAESFPIFNAHGNEAHALSAIGRILGDASQSEPRANAWGRFARIDPQGREHQQCYFAYTAGPDKSHIRLNP